MNDKLRKQFKQKGPIRKVGVLGMGYVGIPSALLFADSPAFEFVWGFQRNSPSSGYKIDWLNSGKCPIDGKEPGLEELLHRVVEAAKFRCTDDMSRISELDAVTIAVETGFRSPETLEPDFDSLNDGLKKIGRHIKPGTLVVIESTISPSMTSGSIRALLEKESGLTAGEDFALAHAPERVMPGRLIRNIREHDRVVGGIDDASTERACELYGPVLTTGRLIPMSATAAELTKTAENAFRDLQIAAANELAVYCEALGVNFYDIRSAIDSLKGEGLSRAVLFPGAGVGGHCLPKDSYHMLRAVKMTNGNLSFPWNGNSLFMAARHINDFMPRHMFRLTREALEESGRSLKGASVAILGWAYKENTDDNRNTPSELLRYLLIQNGARVRVHDPYSEDGTKIEVSSDLDETVKEADIIVIMTAHDEYSALNLSRLKKLMGKTAPIIIDGRNVIDPDTAIEKGFIYKGIGRGDKNASNGSRNSSCT